MVSFTLIVSGLQFRLNTPDKICNEQEGGLSVKAQPPHADKCMSYIVNRSRWRLWEGGVPREQV